MKTEDSTSENGSAENGQAPEEPTLKVAPQDSTEEWKQRATYLMAEIENMRKRFAREKSDVIRFANEEMIKHVIPVLDNLQLAVKAVKDAEDKKTESAKEPNSLFSKLLQGIDMTVKHFEQTLERIGVQAVSAVGQSFDPEKHEAIAQAESAQHKEGEVTAELQKGYTLNGRLIRPARVVVNKATSGQ